MTEGWPVHLLTPYPPFPRLLFGRCAVRSAAFPVNDAAGGQRALIGSAAGTAEADVTARALGELAERVHNTLAGRAAESDPAALIGSYSVLRRKGVPALDPLCWPELAAQPEPARDARLLWVPGESLTGGGEVFVPACAVHLAHRPPPGCAAPLRPGSTGVAAHRTRAAATEHAALEVLERDLLWRAWYGDGPRAVVPFPEYDAPLRDGLAALNLTAAVLVLPGPGNAACVLACLHDGSGAAQSFGARASFAQPEPEKAPTRVVPEGAAALAGPTPPSDSTAVVPASTAAAYGSGPVASATAVRAAVLEALMVRWSLRTPAAEAALRRLVRDGWREVDGPLAHALYAFHRQDGLARLLDGGAAPRRPPAGRTAPPRGPVALSSAGRLLAEHTAEEVVLVGTRAPRAVEAAGDRDVVRIVAPGARRLPARERLGSPPAGARAPAPHPLG